jgi:hypothetical protein
VVSHNVKRELSSEAKPFIPLSAMTYFDTPVNTELFDKLFAVIFSHLIGKSTMYNYVSVLCPPIYRVRSYEDHSEEL